MKLPKEDQVDRDLEIRYASIFELEKELRNHPKVEAKYNRYYAQANNELNLALLQLEIIVATIADEIANSKNIPTYKRDEIRKSMIATDFRYKEAKNNVFEAQHAVDVLKGAVTACASKGWRLKELVYLANRLLWNEPSFTKKDLNNYNDFSGDLNVGKD